MPGIAKLTPQEAADKIKSSTPLVTDRINELTERVFRTRGGRMGSGMGLLLEGLWGYDTSEVLQSDGIEIAWIVDNQYNDFACVDMALDWNPVTMEGELLRIEAKSMNVGADESKAHFAQLTSEIRDDDLLLVLAWEWTEDTSRKRMWPKVIDVWVGG